MTKQQYISELQRLLVFMTAEDVEKVTARYEALFAQAAEDPDAEDALADSLGSPTRVAIRLSHGYAPGGELDLPALPEAPFAEFPAQDVPDPAPEETAAPEAPAPEVDLPQFGMDDLDFLEDLDIPAAPADAEPVAEPAEEPMAEAAPEPVVEAPVEEAEPEPIAEETVEEAAPEPVAEAAEPQAELAVEEPTPYVQPELPQPVRRMPTPKKEVVVTVRKLPLSAGVPLFILAAIVVCLPLAAVTVALFAALLCPGLAVLGAAWLAGVGGLWCISYIADAVLLFGVAFIIAAVGILVLWGGFWLGWQLAGLYAMGLRALAGLLLGRKEIRYE